jgi:hypothetical protein
MRKSNMMVPGKANIGRSTGVTLVELMIAAALLVVAFGTIYVVAQATFASTAFHDTEIAAQDEARSALQSIVTEMREARRTSLLGQTLPGNRLTFRVPGDADANGVPLDISGYLESIGTVTYERDWEDLNGDRETATQLVRVRRDGMGIVTNVAVLANDVMADEDVNGNGILDPGEDLNGSRTLERGIWFERTGSLLSVTVDSQKIAGEGRRVWASVTASVFPRN